MSRRRAWRPKVDTQPEFNPFGSVESGKDSLNHTPPLRDANEDTAPLEGSMDLSDEDSLQDVIAGQYSDKSSAPSADLEKPK